MLRRNADQFVLGVFEDDFVFALVDQEAGQQAAVVRFGEVGHVLGVDQLRRFEHALQQLSASEFLANRGQFRSDFFAVLLNAVTVLARDAGVLEEHAPASRRVARQRENLFWSHDAAQPLDAFFGREKTLEQIAVADVVVLGGFLDGLSSHGLWERAVIHRMQQHQGTACR